MSVFYTFILTLNEDTQDGSMDIVPSVVYGCREHAERVAEALRTHVLAKYGAAGRPEYAYRTRVGIAEAPDPDLRLGDEIVTDAEVDEIVAKYDTQVLFPEEN